MERKERVKKRKGKKIRTGIVVEPLSWLQHWRSLLLWGGRREHNRFSCLPSSVRASFLPAAVFANPREYKYVFSRRFPESLLPDISRRARDEPVTARLGCSLHFAFVVFVSDRLPLLLLECRLLFVRKKKSTKRNEL